MRGGKLFVKTGKHWIFLPYEVCCFDSFTVTTYYIHETAFLCQFRARNSHTLGAGTLKSFKFFVELKWRAGKTGHKKCESSLFH